MSSPAVKHFALIEYDVAGVVCNVCGNDPEDPADVYTVTLVTTIATAYAICNDCRDVIVKANKRWQQ